MNQNQALIRPAVTAMPRIPAVPETDGSIGGQLDEMGRTLCLVVEAKEELDNIHRILFGHPFGPGDPPTVAGAEARCLLDGFQNQNAALRAQVSYIRNGLADLKNKIEGVGQPQAVR